MRFTGWRGGVLLAIIIASAVFFLNLLFLIISNTVWPRENGIATAFTGDCGTAGRWTTAIHLVVNLLSSLLLGASNYCMQRLAAPTRKEVDEAHAKKKWLDIGLPSVRNLAYINIWRTILWVLLALSSVPLHFVYNSVVFETIAANKLQSTVLDNRYLNRDLFENITNSECQARYTSSFITKGGNGFAVPTIEWRERMGMRSNNTIRDWDSGSGKLRVTSSGNTIEFDYCLSQRLPLKCQVHFSLTLLIIVIVCNGVKVVLLTIVLQRYNHETLVTVGDAIKSFVMRPDPSTENCCLMSRYNVNLLWKVPETRMNQRWQFRKKALWANACSKRRFIVSVLLYICALVVSGWLLSLALENHAYTGDSLKAGPGFGRVDTDFLIDIRVPYADSIIPYVLLANLPQTIISFLYLTYNGLFTAMLTGREWARYAIKRAPLRVTIPNPGQRSTYFLQLPYAWSIPLLTASTLLHFFVSQSIFLARVALYENGAPAKTFDEGRVSMYHHFKTAGNILTGVGYSGSALIASIAWGSALVIACVLVAAIGRYPIGLPVGGTNSAVISAACHMRREGESEHCLDEDTVEKPVKWGVTVEGTRYDVGHCCFSSGEVDFPKYGALYAGLGERKDAEERS
ncbi:hypothetical protein CC78DRAFT_12199 [Lojkania enalia]|uniref:DUF6536 domain-containing protein n=1 Tax=Lojkania enalia TaxID=147567 RepID=A0A9P4TR40_9PLEO|nr:hypothetical protein CC78DRAFT_12199 [Didymosphaeria enalia]